MPALLPRPRRHLQPRTRLQRVRITTNKLAIQVINPRPLLGVAELLVVPLVSLLFQAALFERPLLLVTLLFTGTVGFSAVGTLFAAMLVRARTRDVLLPILLYPITVPVIIAGVRATEALLQPDIDAGAIRFWIALLVTFDVVFVTLALWTFEPLMTD